MSESREHSLTIPPRPNEGYGEAASGDGGTALALYDPDAIWITDPDEAALCQAARDIHAQLGTLLTELQTLRTTRVLPPEETEALLARQYNRIRDGIAILSSIIDDIERPFP